MKHLVQDKIEKSKISKNNNKNSFWNTLYFIDQSENCCCTLWI